MYLADEFKYAGLQLLEGRGSDIRLVGLGLEIATREKSDEIRQLLNRP